MSRRRSSAVSKPEATKQSPHSRRLLHSARNDISLVLPYTFASKHRVRYWKGRRSMANEEQLAILRQGVEVWNKWREKYPNTEVNLRGANLVGARLGEVNFSTAILMEANLKEASLIGSDLRAATLVESNLNSARLMNADLSSADLEGADLSDAWLGEANLMFAHFNKANLTGAHLVHANLIKASLEDADLRRASLGFVNFRDANLTRANFEGASFHSTNFANVNLSEVRCLDKTFHDNPSTIGTDTLTLSQGKIPEKFLQACGLSDWEIEVTKLYNPELSGYEINNILSRIKELRK